MTQGENKEVIKYDKSKKYSDWTDKNLWTYKDKEKVEEEKGIISRSENKTIVNVDTALEVNGEWIIISILKVKKKKNTEERKMKGILSTLRRNQKVEFWWEETSAR